MKEPFLLFDLDGTLWDSAANVAESWNIVMQQYSTSLPILTSKDIQNVMGKTMSEIADMLLPDLPEADRNELFTKCSDFEVEYIAEHGGILFPDVSETLSTLYDAGYSMAIISNCQAGYIDAFLHSMGMGKYFCDKEEWGNTGLRKSQNIRLVMERNNFADAVYIGDTEKDMRATQKAGIPFIYASYGFGNLSGIEPSINSIAELPGVLESFVKNR